MIAGLYSGVLTSEPQPSSARNHSGFRSPDESMSAASIRQEPSLLRTLYWKGLPVSSASILSHTPLLFLIRTFSPSNPRKLLNVKESSRDTTLCLAAAHALVKLDDGTVVGDPMEKTTLDSLEWTVGKNEAVHPVNTNAPHKTLIIIKRRFQFSSALKRMSTLASLPGGKIIASVKGAPETIKGMLSHVPDGYDDTYKWFTRNGSRVLALGIKEMEPMTNDKVCTLNGIHERSLTNRRRSTSCTGLRLRASSSLLDS